MKLIWKKCNITLQFLHTHFGRELNDWKTLDDYVHRDCHIVIGGILLVLLHFLSRSGHAKILYKSLTVANRDRHRRCHSCLDCVSSLGDSLDPSSHESHLPRHDQSLVRPWRSHWYCSVSSFGTTSSLVTYWNCGKRSLAVEHS